MARSYSHTHLRFESFTLLMFSNNYLVNYYFAMQLRTFHMLAIIWIVLAISFSNSATFRMEI